MVDKSSLRMNKTRAITDCHVYTPCHHFCKGNKKDISKGGRA